ncbi:alcohol dehydrogenase [Paraphoma chrysanthemicola]|uniref:Alcohol dehydrogenase n=1 Tax=Paraphoma chrysanthemicola TaxID=798071 RepID=A0A8K0R6D6_9PLEO|nr:alcohol dehydrogenase [Paraphoma chrysanthemicola]
MRALIRAKPDYTLSLDPSHPEPTIAGSPDCYIIQTKAVALTRGELTWPEPLEPDTPIPGYDFAGVIISAPTTCGEKGFETGSEVYGFTFPFSRQGNARDVTVAEEAASVPLSALTAWQGLFIHGGMSPPNTSSNATKRVLVTAASGGVGIWAVQLAHQAGIEVVATCGSSNVAIVSDLGADMVLDYTKTDLVDWVNEDCEKRRFDTVLDCIGGQTLTDAWRLVKTNGTVVSVAEPPNSKRPLAGVAEGVQGVWFIVEADHRQLDRITDLIERGKCRCKVDRVYALEEWKEAFDRLESGHARGKIVLRMS